MTPSAPSVPSGTHPTGPKRGASDALTPLTLFGADLFERSPTQETRSRVMWRRALAVKLNNLRLRHDQWVEREGNEPEVADTDMGPLAGVVLSPKASVDDVVHLCAAVGRAGRRSRFWENTAAELFDVMMLAVRADRTRDVFRHVVTNAPNNETAVIYVTFAEVDTEWNKRRRTTALTNEGAVRGLWALVQGLLDDGRHDLFETLHTCGEFWPQLLTVGVITAVLSDPDSVTIPERRACAAAAVRMLDEHPHLFNDPSDVVLVSDAGRGAVQALLDRMDLNAAAVGAPDGRSPIGRARRL